MLFAYVVKIIKSRKVRWAGNVVGMGKKIYSESLERMDHFGHTGLGYGKMVGSCEYRNVFRFY
jgi:hypothetical protein